MAKLAEWRKEYGYLSNPTTASENLKDFTVPIYQNNSIKFIRNSQLKNIELRFSSYRKRAFDKHTHDTYAIGIVKGGMTEFCIHGRTEMVRGGEISLINPGEVHACNPQSGSPLTYFMFYVEPTLILKIASELSEMDAVAVRFTTAIVRDKRLFRELLRLSEEIETSCNTLETEVILHQLLTEIIDRYGEITGHEDEDGRESDIGVEAGLGYLMDNLFENISLKELASHTGLSQFHLLRKFRRYYGLPPHTYQLQQRVNSAKRLLACGKPIADVALETGFADQSHFTRKFKSFVGVTPRKYQLADS